MSQGIHNNLRWWSHIPDSWLRWTFYLNCLSSAGAFSWLLPLGKRDATRISRWSSSRHMQLTSYHHQQKLYASLEQMCNWSFKLDSWARWQGMWKEDQLNLQCHVHKVKMSMLIDQIFPPSSWQSWRAIGDPIACPKRSWWWFVWPICGIRLSFFEELDIIQLITLWTGTKLRPG